MLLPLLVAATLAVAIVPAANAMDFSCPAPGTTIEFDSGVKVIARGKAGNDCLMDDVGGKPFRMRALMLANPGPDGTDTSAFVNAIRPERLFPLAVGKRIEARHSSSAGSWTYVITVARTDLLQGAAGGAHETFVIEMTEQATNGPYRSIQRWWISPRHNYFLRYDFSDSNNRSNRALVTKISN
jgi:hypothetical protein